MKHPFEPNSSVFTVFNLVSMALGHRGSDVNSLSGFCRDIA